MRVRVSHPTGNANLRSLLGGLDHKSILEQFYTTVATFDDDLLDRLSDFKLLNDFKRRKFDNRFKHLTNTSPFSELSRIVAMKLGFEVLVNHETGLFCIDNICRRLDIKVAKSLQSSNVDAIYAYEDNAVESFKVAKLKGIRCLYDLPIGYWRSAHTILEKEKERNPEWEKTITGLKDSYKKLARKDKELELADHIFVASKFTAKTLNEYPGTLAPIHTIPYGFPPPYEERIYRNLSGKIKLLFVGGLSQRKGISEVFQLQEKYGKYVELTIIGRKPVQDCLVLNDKLTKVRWIPSLPHQKILEEMRCHDILIFPSLFEGFGLVITEAMSQGTPVLTTTNTIGPDFISTNENGWVVEAGNGSDLLEKFESIISNPDIIKENGLAARKTASERPWSVYSQEIALKILSI